MNRSLSNFSVYKNDIVFALTAIKNVGYRSGYEIVQDRINFGRYLDIDDFLKRMNKKVDYQAAVSLVKAGALDTFGYNRATLMKKLTIIIQIIGSILIMYVLPYLQKVV